ncbi:MAG: glycosyltransferase family 39 protein, partial [Chloroflexota bacterium]
MAQSGNFYYALGQRDPAETYRREHPAITTIWAGFAGYLATIPEYRGWGQGYVDTMEMEAYLENKDVKAIDILAAGRFFMVVGTTILLMAIFYFAKRLLGILPALAGILVLAFSPFHIALSRVLHVDGTLSNLILLTTLSYLSYLYLGRNNWDLAAASVGAGFTLITKAPGLFLLPFIGLITLLPMLQEWRVNKQPFGSLAQKFILPMIVWGGLTLATIFIVWPAMWVQPLEVFNNVYLRAIRYASGGHNKPLFFDGQIIADGSIGLKYFYFYPLTYLWRTTPLAILGLAGAVFAVFKQKILPEKPHIKKVITALFLLAVTYMAFMTLGLKKFDRYALPAYLPLDLI